MVCQYFHNCAIQQLWIAKCFIFSESSVCVVAFSLASLKTAEGLFQMPDLRCFPVSFSAMINSSAAAGRCYACAKFFNNFVFASNANKNHRPKRYHSIPIVRTILRLLRPYAISDKISVYAKTTSCRYPHEISRKKYFTRLQDRSIYI